MQGTKARQKVYFTHLILLQNSENSEELMPSFMCNIRYTKLLIKYVILEERS